MIFGKLEDLERLVASTTGTVGLGSDGHAGCFETSMASALRWLNEERSAGLLRLELGRHIIEGATSENRLPTAYANVEMTPLRLSNQALFERHKHYADVQIVLEGEEAFEIACDASGECGDYSEARDVAFFEAESLVKGVLRPGFFVLYRSGEPHKPALVPEGKADAGPIRKVVIKVLDEGR